MIHAFTQSTFLVYISTEDNRIENRVASTQIRHLFKFINDMDGSIQYAYGSSEIIYNRYTKFTFLYSSGFPLPVDMYAGETWLIPAGHFKYEVYEVTWIGTVGVALNTAPATEIDVLPVANTNGVVQGLVTKGILYVTEKVGTEQVQYTQHEEPDGENYIWYGDEPSPPVTPDAFNFSINTVNTSAGSSSSKQYQLPLVDAGAITMVVYWGDGTEDIITSYNQAETLHTYATSGVYNVSITNEVRGWKQWGNIDEEKILNISKWEAFNITEELTFTGCINLTGTATDKPVVSSTSLNSSFTDCTLWNGTMDSWDVSSVTNMNGLFFNCPTFDQPLNSWNTSSVTIMSVMFSGCGVFDQDISSWDVSNVLVMNGMFFSCSAFNQPLNSWNVSSVIDPHGMFRNATAFDQPLNSWNTSAFTNIGTMFVGSSFDQNISSWDVRNVTTAIQFLFGITLSTANYDAILVAWDANTPVASTLTIDFGNSQYSLGSAAETARTNLITTHGWTITDGGGI